MAVSNCLPGVVRSFIRPTAAAPASRHGAKSARVVSYMYRCRPRASPAAFSCAPAALREAKAPTPAATRLPTSDRPADVFRNAGMSANDRPVDEAIVEICSGLRLAASVNRVMSAETSVRPLGIDKPSGPRMSAPVVELIAESIPAPAPAPGSESALYPNASAPVAALGSRNCPVLLTKSLRPNPLDTFPIAAVASVGHNDSTQSL